MFDSAVTSPCMVFLHIPKTAGQTVHNALARAVGLDQVSPIRVHTQAQRGCDQFPEGYKLYSGHIDWTNLDRVPDPKFVFSILRDPRERIASFYFYLRKEARQLSAADLNRPQNAGKRAVLEQSADDYFFGGTPGWQTFIKDHYDNFYCRYFGSQKIRAGDSFSALPDRRKLRAAMRSFKSIDWIYSVERLDLLEDDIKTLFGYEVDLRGTRHNTGDLPLTQARWPRLLDAFETDAARSKIEDYVSLDMRFMSSLEL